MSSKLLQNSFLFQLFYTFKANLTADYRNSIHKLFINCNLQHIRYTRQISFSQK